MLIVALVAGGITADAKKSKSKSSSGASVKFGTFYDGYPDIGGHTYTGSMQGVKFTVKFHPYTGTNSVVDIKASKGGYWEEEINNWYYKGNGMIMFYLNGGEPCYYEIRNDGRELYSPQLNFTLKVTK